MDVSSSGRLKKMGLNPDKPKNPEVEENEENEISKKELSETSKLRLARKPTQVDIDMDDIDELDCPGCGKHMEPGMIICLACEMNVKTGKKIKTKIRPSRRSSKTQNAYATPEANNDLETPEYGGLSRGKYWLWSFLIPIISMIAIFGLAVVFGASMAMIDDPNKTIPMGILVSIGIVYMAMLVGYIYIQVKRLHNLGSSGWLCLLQLVPIANLWLAYRICCCPEGYADHKTLDKTGKILIGILVFFVIMSLLLSVLPMML